MDRVTKDLKKAVKLVEQIEQNKVENDRWRLNFHLIPKVGWLNDPNGLCEYKGEYHIFFQYAPFDAEGGLIFWGHYKTKDFINWQYLEPALYPDEAFDCHGVYSGSALIDDDKMYLYYTGNVKYSGDYDYTLSGRGHDTVLVCSDDGINFNNKKVVIDSFPENMTCHVRDPKVWKKNNTYYMVQGARDKNDIAQVILFSSDDRENWKVANILKSEKDFGYMWECPDLFELDSKHILLVSPQGIEEDGLKYNNVYQSGYFVIEGDFKDKYKLNDFVELDRGFDFYAPQTFKDTKGRRILIAWLGLPDIKELYSNPTVEYGWQHALTIPRQLAVKNNKIFQTPIEEIENLRDKHYYFEIDKQFKMNLDCCYEAVLNILNLDSDLEILIKQCAKIVYSENILTLEFVDGGYGRTKRAVKLDSLDSLRIFCDTSSIEIFVNDGEEVFTTRFYPKQNQSEFKVKGTNLKCNFDLWELSKFIYN